MPRLPRVQRADLARAGGVAALVLGLLATLKLVARFDQDVATELPDSSAMAWWLAVAIVLAQAVLLAWSSAAPQGVLVAVAGLALASALVPLEGLANLPLIAVALAAYVATRRRRDEDSWIPLAASTALVAAAGFLSARHDPSMTTVLAVGVAFGQALLAVGLPVAIAMAVRARATVAQARESEALARVREHEARTQAAVEAERTAIARELHDIAAHHLSGIALMASAISQQVDTDPRAAKESLGQVRTQTRVLLDELRGLVALLRNDDGGGTTNVEGLAALESLVATTAARGLDVTLHMPASATIDELARGIGPLGQFAAYRTVQEALANVTRHAPGAKCQVAVREAGDWLEITVSNGPGGEPVAARGPGEGFGIRGMTERAALTRSRLSYGPTEDHGWRVELRVPKEAR